MPSNCVFIRDCHATPVSSVRLNATCGSVRLTDCHVLNPQITLFCPVLGVRSVVSLGTMISPAQLYLLCSKRNVAKEKNIRMRVDVICHEEFVSC